VTVEGLDGETGLGYTYGHKAIAEIVSGKLAGAVSGMDAPAPSAAWGAMSRAVRNSLASGLCGFAISAVDVALHDLKAKPLGVSLADLLGRWHDGVDVLPADPTRSGGVPGVLRADALAKAAACHSRHTARRRSAPTSSRPARPTTTCASSRSCSTARSRPPAPSSCRTPRPGLGIELKRADAEQFRVH
jgi:L-alanine-DL-glutamate epimerase-like enolase superfamily enzyme